jgi:hypothetical protein
MFGAQSHLHASLAWSSLSIVCVRWLLRLRIRRFAIILINRVAGVPTADTTARWQRERPGRATHEPRQRIAIRDLRAVFV